MYEDKFNKKLKEFSDSHLDILLKTSKNISDLRKIFEQFLKVYKFKLHENKISYYSKIKNQLVEVVGFVIKDILYYTNFKRAKIRPDISIERIGLDCGGNEYDEHGRGYRDFNNKKIVVNSNFKGDINLEKSLKIIQIKYQLDFKFDKRTKTLIIKSLKVDSSPKIKFFIELINKRSNKNFKSIKEIRGTILQEKF